MFSDSELASAQRQVTRAARKAARQLPLFAAAGILDQVAPPVSAEQVLVKRQAGRTDFAARLEASYQRQAATATRYRGAVEQIIGPEAAAAAAARFEQRFGPKTAEYRADYWHHQLAQATGHAVREVHVAADGTLVITCDQPTEAPYAPALLFTL